MKYVQRVSIAEEIIKEPTTRLLRSAMQNAAISPGCTPALSDEAYSVYPGPVLVLAGPGTGKTYQLARRVQFLVSQANAKASEITVITFTQEAARSMRTKMWEQGSLEFVPEESRPGRISTMHSLGYAIVRENTQSLGLNEDFKVIEDDEIRTTLFRDAALNLGLKLEQGDKAKNDKIKGVQNLSNESRLIAKEYDLILRRCNSIDYDDQILLACTSLNSDQTVLTKWQATARFLLIDEYQDINPAQFNLISILTESHRSGLFVVGDDDQSIYQFRGGTPRFIREFRSHFGPDSKIIQMATSRRCKKMIMEVANALVKAHDRQRVPKALPIFLEPDCGEVRIHNFPSDLREAKSIASTIKDEIERGIKEHRSSFILVPNRNYTPPIEEALAKAEIPFSVQTGESIALKHLFTIKEWCEQPGSDLVTRQVIQFAADAGVAQIPSPKSRKPEKLQQRIEALSKIARLWKSDPPSGTPFWTQLLQASEGPLKELAAALSLLKDAYEADSLDGFLGRAQGTCKPWTSLKAFFDEMATVEKNKKRPAQTGPHTVRIMTMQGSKGLQANSVFVIGLEAENMPRSAEEEQIAEDARLLFVAITRAKDAVHLCHARLRKGSVTFKAVSHGLKESPFLKNLPVPKEKRHYHRAY